MADNLYSFLQSKGKSGWGSLTEDLPCYMERVNADYRFTKIADIRGYLSAALEDVAAAGDNTKTGILCISVTTREKGYAKWLKAAKEFPGSQVVVSRTKWHQGKYKCFFVTIPVNPKVK